ncbi:MAG: GC-type dockerin domain-anchored protein [Phycisphaerales bacterium]
MRPIGILALTSLALAQAAVAAACPPDLDGSGDVNAADLAAFLNRWGTSDPFADLDGDGNVGGADLAALLGSWGPCPPAGDPTATSLSAVAAGSFPSYFLVNAFNSGATVGFAVDPVRFSDLAGATVDVYLVGDRSAAEWLANPTLNDVRGSFQTAVLPTDPLNPVVSLVNMASVLAGNGESPGRPLDLVIDVDRNGVLSSADLLDGAEGPGLWYVKDLTGLGPYTYTSISSYDVNDPDIGDSFELERIYYPTNIASLPPRPLVVISHGNGHQYTWYDYLGFHLASWGYVVMSHQNDTVAGIEAASTTTVEHTESFLAQLGTIGGGVLNGKVDGDRIVWIGHSRGGEGIARGYDRLFDGTFTSPNYQISDIRLLISIAPTDFLGTASSNPHGAPFMLLYGSADGDVCGCPDSDVADSFNIFERAEGLRQSTYVHGADHNDFNCCGINDFSGPSGTAIGTVEAQRVAKAACLAMIRRVVEDDRSVEEYLWRQYESLRPAGVAASTTVIQEWKPLASTTKVIDNFQTNTSTGQSSSGGAVAFAGIAAISESLQNDNNTTFTWATTDPFNGATRGRTSDLTRALVFEWNAPSSIEWSVPAALKDFSASAFVSLRAAQGTRHPNTTAQLGDLTFTVAVVDELGVESAVSIGAFAGGVEEPYQRAGFPTTTVVGWQNAMEAIRVPLSAFTANGRPIDLTRVASVVLRFGSGSGSTTGRLVIDDLQVEQE